MFLYVYWRAFVSAYLYALLSCSFLPSFVLVCCIVLEQIKWWWWWLLVRKVLFIPSPFLDYLYDIWQLLSALRSDLRKKSYICTSIMLVPKPLRWNFLQISQLSIRSSAHKRFRRYLDFSKFSNAIPRKLWRHLVWLGDRVVRTLDLRSIGREFESGPLRYRVQPWASC